MPIAILLLLLSAAPAKGNPDAGVACWTRAQRIDHGRVWPCLKSPKPRADGRNEAICAPTEAEVLAQAASINARPCAPAPRAKGEPDAGSACWYYAPGQVAGETVLCLKTDTAPIHLNGEVDGAFCARTAAELRAKTDPLRLPTCPGTRPPAKFDTPPPVTVRPPRGPAEPCWKWERQGALVCLRSEKGWRIVSGVAQNTVCGASVEAVQRVAKTYAIPVCSVPPAS